MIKVTNGKGEEFNSNNDDGVVRAFIDNDCTHDAEELVLKFKTNSFSTDIADLKMPSHFSTMIECKAEDKYDRKEGIGLACKKLVRKHQLSQYKAVKRWKNLNLLKLMEFKPNILKTYDKNDFRAEIVRDKIVKDIRDKFKEWGVDKAVIGISGGKDSTVCAGLLARALGAENVYGILMPWYAQESIDDAFEVVKSLGIKYRVCSIDGLNDALESSILGGFHTSDEAKIYLSGEAEINAIPRLRMTLLRYITQSLEARLCGTSNLSEIFVGYCTKDGDTSCDFNPIGLITSWEVVQVGLSMKEIPERLVKKVPKDDLCGVSDEEKMGVTYDEIHMLIRTGTCGNKEVDKLILDMHKKSEHKRKPAYKMLQDALGDIKNKYLDYIR